MPGGQLTVTEVLKLNSHWASRCGQFFQISAFLIWATISNELGAEHPGLQGLDPIPKTCKKTWESVARIQQMDDGIKWRD